VHSNIHLINFILCRGGCALYRDQWTLEWNMAHDCESLNYYTEWATKSSPPSILHVSLLLY